ncbi:nicotinamide phosphoribosyl transferase [Escherichia phage vB_EcoM_Alf5]|uniref:Nicotinamide phosphoribosyltransferase n=1 Tax=Escherichia phage vB_EcoM_Alf5 TaxID=1873990 RepID=A0A1B1PDF2_9CAUD|nr:nicotinamide phosphoribosyl transferase [Escherichia phage vB_EcoM_Alf5]ANT42192.1 putative nicotinamide phosphoribosyltransferase [Escherichia phage vB_EcoM_Alf5]
MTKSLYAVPAGLNADAYKSGHVYQYPSATEYLMFNLTPRSDKWFNSPLAIDGVVAFGIQRFVKDYLIDHWNATFFERDKKEAIDEILEVMNGVLGKDAIGREHWEALHDLGYLPVEVYAVEEGTVVPMRVPMVVFQNTVSGFHWVAGYLEDAFSAEIWKACTIATIALHYKRICKKWADITCDNDLHLPYQCHDFAMRGMSGFTDDAFNAVGHLTSFKGTDSFPAVYTAKRIYGQSYPISDIGSSVPATEHSVMCANIAWEGGNELIEEERRFKGELQTFRRFLTETYPTGIASIVSDTYNFWRTVSEILPALRKEIMERDGKLVIRPDSGDPVHIVTGYKAIHLECAKKAYYEHLSKLEASDTMLNAVLNMKLENISYGIAGWLLSEGYEMVVDREDFEAADTVMLKDAYMVGSANVVTRPVAEIDGAIKTLYNIFGGTINSKGFKVLDEHIGLIYGDSITLERANEILKRLYEMGFASSNVVFGVGSYTYQYMTRDTFAFAVKATLASIGGKEIMLAKDPKTDSGVKKSAFGGVSPMWDGEKLKAVDGYGIQSFADALEHPACALRLVFSNSEQFGYTTLGDIRNNIDKQL